MEGLCLLALIGIALCMNPPSVPRSLPVSSHTQYSLAGHTAWRPLKTGHIKPGDAVRSMNTAAEITLPQGKIVLNPATEVSLFEQDTYQTQYESPLCLKIYRGSCTFHCSVPPCTLDVLIGELPPHKAHITLVKQGDATMRHNNDLLIIDKAPIIIEVDDRITHSGIALDADGNEHVLPEEKSLYKQLELLAPSNHAHFLTHRGEEINIMLYWRSQETPKIEIKRTDEAHISHHPTIDARGGNILLPAGTYTWRIKQGSETSELRTFEIEALSHVK